MNGTGATPIIMNGKTAPHIEKKRFAGQLADHHDLYR
jgi:hypothetical protein